VDDENANAAVEAAIAQELRLLDPAVRADRSLVDALLAPDFTEIGQHGRVWTRDAVLEAIAGSAAVASTPIALGGRLVAPSLVLVFYQTAGSTGPPVRRATLWRETPRGWQAVFHQGTPVTD
jgi:hypothetical protein